MCYVDFSFALVMLKTEIKLNLNVHIKLPTGNVLGKYSERTERNTERFCRKAHFTKRRDERKLRSE